VKIRFNTLVVGIVDVSDVAGYGFVLKFIVLKRLLQLLRSYRIKQIYLHVTPDLHKSRASIPGKIQMRSESGIEIIISL